MIARLLIYREALADLTDAEFMAAVDRAIAECAWYPAPAQLLSFARPRLGDGRSPEDDFDPLAAWKRDQDEARRLGAGSRLLPERAVSAEQAAERAARFAALRDETVARMRAATDEHRANARVRQSRRRLVRAGWVRPGAQNDAGGN